MIRRVVEYIISCDAQRITGTDCKSDPMGYASAYSSRTLDECAESATKDGWKQISARLWLCSRCAKANDDEQQKDQP